MGSGYQQQGLIRVVGNIAGSGWASARIWAQASVGADGISVSQIIAAVSIGLTVVMLGFSLWKGLKRARLRPLLDVARIVLQAATAVAVPIITGVATTPALVLAALGIGLVLGFVQGQRLLVEVDGSRLFATRSMAGFAIWGIGLVLMQGAGLANRTGLVELGQAVTWLSIGITAGLILGRHAKVSSTLQLAATRAAPAVLVLVALASGCEVEVDTTIQNDGSGLFETAIGVEPDPVDPQTCQLEAGDELPPLATGYYPTDRGRGLVWCAIGYNFDSLDALGDIYVNLDEGQGGVIVECLAFVDGQMAYRVLVQIEPSDDGTTLPWSVTVPGEITSSNAHQVNGSTATWVLGTTAGFVPMEINVSDDGRCPSEGFSLKLAANADGSGTATLRAPRLSTGEADTQVLVADLLAGGWATTAPPVGAASFGATQSWGSAEDLQSVIDSLPQLEGSEVDLVPDAASGETDFNARIDLSFYETYWRNVNPILGDPPFTLDYVPADGVLSTSGAWTDQGALVFDWSVDSDGRIFNLFASTGPDGDEVPAGGGLDSEQPDGGDGQDGNGSDGGPAGGEQGDGRGDGQNGEQAGDTGNGDSDSDKNDAPLTPEAQAAQDLLDLLDSKEVSENEALATAVAGLAAAAAAGLLSLAEAARAAQELVEAAAENQRAAAPAPPAPSMPEPAPPEPAPQRPPGRLRDMSLDELRRTLPHIPREELDRWVDALQNDIDNNALTNLPPFLDEILGLEGIRERIAAGTLTAEDLETVLRGKDLTHAAIHGPAIVDRAVTEGISNHLFLYGGMAEASLVTSKMAAGIVGGPGGTAAITALVDAVAAREHGVSNALKIGVFNAGLDFAQGSFAGAIAKLPASRRITGGAISGGMAAWSQNIHSQLVANGGDTSKLDLDAANNAGLLGMGTGGLGGIDGAPPDVPKLQGNPRGFSGPLGDGFSLNRGPAPDLPAPRPSSGGVDVKPTGRASSGVPDAPTPRVTANTPDAAGPTNQVPKPPPPAAPDAAGPTNQVPKPPPPAAPDAAGPTNQVPEPSLPPPPAPPEAPAVPIANEPASPQVLSARPPKNPHADLPAGQATNPETQQILNNLETSPQAGADAGGPGLSSRPQDLDHEGNVWAGRRQIGTMDEQGQIVNANQQPIKIAHDLETGASVGYVEVDTSGLPGRPLHNGRGESVGRVSQSGHILNPDGSIQMHNGAPARAAIDANGNLVPYDGPDLADVRTEYDQAYSGRRVEHANPNQTPAPDLHALSPETRVPVLDSAGNPSHMVEAVPREIHFDANGQPQYVQHQFPARAQSMGDVDILKGGGELAPGQEPLRMPTPDNWGGSTVKTPLAGPDAPPASPAVRADASGTSPTGHAATNWDAVGANADGVAVSPSGSPVIRVDAQGNFFDMSGQAVTRVAARDGRVIGFTDAGGQRWIVDDGPTS